MLRALLTVFAICGLFTIQTYVLSARPLAANGSRPIVYSARYYLPPGSQGTSHFHLYRINPDGSGQTQITFGDQDDLDPVWSPDRKWIAFERADEFDSDHHELSLFDVATGHIHRLASCDWYEYHPDYFWERSPLRLIVPAYREGTRRIFQAPSWAAKEERWDNTIAQSRSGQWRAYIDDSLHLMIQRRKRDAWQTLFRKPGVWMNCVWTSSSTLAVLRQINPVPPGQNYDQVVSLFKIARSGSIAQVEHAVRNCDANSVSSIPNHPSDLVLEIEEFNSTTGGTMDFTEYLLATDTLRSLAPFSEFLAFSPTGSQFATAPARDTVPYSHWHGGQVRTVWAAPLYVVDTKSGKKRRLTPLTTWVYSADWRK